MVLARKWIITLFVDKVTQDLPKAVTDAIMFGCGQIERCPDTGKLHWQAYYEFKNRIGIKKVKELLHAPSAHVEMAVDPDKSVLYCQKEESYVESRFMFGERVQNGKESDFDGMVKAIKLGKRPIELLEQFKGTYAKHYKFADRVRSEYDSMDKSLREIKTVVYCGATGVGKSRRAFDEGNAAGGFYRWMPSEKLWMDGYNGEPVLWIDDFNGSGISITQMLQLTDPYPLQLEKKGSSCFAKWTKVIITTNQRSIKEWYPHAPLPQLLALSRRMKFIEMVREEIEIFGEELELEKDVITLSRELPQLPDLLD